MKKTPILVSACLAGIFCRYNGEVQSCEPVIQLVREGRAIPFCPEVHGGLTTPRLPCEMHKGQVFDSQGNDLTSEFRRGAGEGLRLAQLAGCREAILKANSPSCGSGTIYDGTFSGRRIPGNGMLAELLLAHGIAVRSEEELDRV